MVWAHERAAPFMPRMAMVKKNIKGFRPISFAQDAQEIYVDLQNQLSAGNKAKLSKLCTEGAYTVSDG